MIVNIKTNINDRKKAMECPKNNLKVSLEMSFKITFRNAFKLYSILERQPNHLHTWVNCLNSNAASAFY